MKNYLLKALLTHLTLTHGKWGDDDLFIGTDKKKGLVDAEVKEYEK